MSWLALQVYIMLKAFLVTVVSYLSVRNSRPILFLILSKFKQIN